MMVPIKLSEDPKRLVDLQIQYAEVLWEDLMNDYRRFAEEIIHAQHHVQGSHPFPLTPFLESLPGMMEGFGRNRDQWKTQLDGARAEDILHECITVTRGIYTFFSVQLSSISDDLRTAVRRISGALQ